MIAASFHCRGCGRTLTAAAAVLEHCADPHAQRPAICRGVLEPIGRDQLVPAGAGDRLGQADAGGGEGVAGHENTMRSAAVAVTENRCADGSQRFTEVA